MWGYPLDVTNELDDGNHVTPRPDLIFSEGHIRRRLTDIKFRGIYPVEKCTNLAMLPGQAALVHRSAFASLDEIPLR